MASETSNTLCDTCRRIIDTIRDVEWHQNLDHQLSRGSLNESAQEGCGICAVLKEHLESNAFQQVPDLWDNIFPLKCESDTSSASWQTSFELILTSDGVKSFNLKFTLEVIEEFGSEEAHIPSSTTDSPASWKLVRQWLKKCTENHERCNASVPEPWAPTRLLDLGTKDNDSIRLVERDDTLFSRQPYATISHCWGGVPIFMTTKATLTDRQKGIRHTDLSKTFNDAVRIARLLGLRYLWIDSICIVQDSKDDWVRESDIMSKVYRYAFINIAATGAADGSEGCFWNRDPRAVRPTELSIQWSNCKDSNPRKYHVAPEPHLWSRKLVNQPLNQRGWVFQERILSPRCLHFGSEQLFWECREFVACETYHQGLPSSLRGNPVIDIKTLDLGDEPYDDRWPAKYISNSTTSSKTVLGRVFNVITDFFKPIVRQEVTLNTNMKGASIYRDWDAVVELYSMGSLTFATDKLVALSGLASSLAIGEQNTIGDGYLAGLWHSSLPSHLLWVTQNSEKTWDLFQGQTSNAEPSKPKRHNQYIAPSWSWASIDGQISMTWCLHNYDTRDYLARLEVAEVNWSDIGARFGQVTSGYLKLESPLASVLWQEDFGPARLRRAAKITHVFPTYLDRNSAVFIPPNASTSTEILFDTLNDDLPEELTLLPIIGITRRTAHETETVLGLVIKKLEATETYLRIGFFYTMRPRASRILRNMPRQTVTIV